MIKKTVMIHRTEWRNSKGKLHRIKGPACEYANGNKSWYINGKLHRKDGPAVELSNESKYWFINGKYHREDGPAIEYADGYKEYWINDQQINCNSNEEFLRIVKMKAFL